MSDGTDRKTEDGAEPSWQRGEYPPQSPVGFVRSDWRPDAAHSGSQAAPGTAAMVLIFKSIHESSFLDGSLAAPPLFRKCIHCSASCLREAGPQVCGCQSSWTRWFSQAAGKSSFILLEPLTSAALNAPVEPVRCQVIISFTGDLGV